MEAVANISEIMSGVERSRIDSEKNFSNVLDKVHELSKEAVDISSLRSCLASGSMFSLSIHFHATTPTDQADL
ncbi:MAG: hypothetical protein WCL11_12540, partial [Verrucomicrobiota bacterium]